MSFGANVDLTSLSQREEFLQILNKLRKVQNQTMDLALAWYHLGNQVEDDRQAFLAHWMALEILTADLRSNRSTVLKEHFKEPKSKDRFINDFSKLLDRYRFNDIAKARLKDYLRRTETQSEVEKYQEALKKINIDASLEQLRGLVSARGALVHSGSAPNVKDRCHELTGILRRAFQIILRFQNMRNTYMRKDSFWETNRALIGLTRQ